jgi:uncharacterized protein with PIN domain
VLTEVRFHGGLGRDGAVSWHVPPTVKDAVEGLGVPHTEVGRVLVDGREVALDARLVDGEVLDVRPHEGPRPRPPGPVRFVVDDHLHALARRLRVLGFDAGDAGPGIVLTRDRSLLKRSAVEHGLLVRSQVPDEQVVEVVRAYGLADELRPFTRCTACNGVLHDVAKADVLDDLEPLTAAHMDRFRRCGSCGHLYWRGSHHARLERLVDEVRRLSRRRDG